MPEGDDGGHSSAGGDAEYNPWWKFGGSVADTKEDGNKGKYVDPAFTALHDMPDYLNAANAQYGLTETARNANAWAGANTDALARAAQADHLAANATMMGNDTSAAAFAARGDSLRETAEGFKGASEQRGMLNTVFESPYMKVGGNVAGAALGGLSMYNGIDEIRHGKATQGAMDLGAGAIGAGGSLATLGGMGASALGMTGAAATLGTIGAVAAPVGIVAGLAAAGNSWTKDHDIFGGLFGSKKGTWGENPDGSARDSLQFVGQTTAGAYHGVDNAVENKLGHGFWGQAAGKTAGALAGAGTAIGTGAAALVTDVAGGVAATGQGLWNGAKALGSGIGSVASSVGSGIGSAAKSVGSGIASGAKAIGGGISSAAHSVGSFVKSLW